MMSVQPRKPMVAPPLVRTIAGRRAAAAFLPTPTTFTPAARPGGSRRASRRTLIDGVVIGHVHDVDAGVGQSAASRGRPGSGRPCRVRIADVGQRRLEVTQAASAARRTGAMPAKTASAPWAAM